MADTPDRSELRRLAKAATPGLWSLGEAQQDNLYGGKPWPQVWPAIGAPVADLNGRPGAPAKDTADAALIVAAVNALPALLDALDSRDARIASLTTLLAKTARFYHGAAPMLMNGSAARIHNVPFEECTDDECREARAALGGSDDATGG